MGVKLLFPVSEKCTEFTSSLNHFSKTQNSNTFRFFVSSCFLFEVAIFFVSGTSVSEETESIDLKYWRVGRTASLLRDRQEVSGSGTSS